MSRIIDLTVSMKDGMRGVTFEAFKVLEKDGWNARMLHLYSHAGTHVDAPLHFGVNETTIDRIPPERFIADAWVVDAPAVTDSMRIGIEHLGDVKDRLSAGEGLLFRTGWHRFIDAGNYRTALFNGAPQYINENPFDLELDSGKPARPPCGSCGENAARSSRPKTATTGRA